LIFLKFAASVIALILLLSIISIFDIELKISEVWTKNGEPWGGWRQPGSAEEEAGGLHQPGGQDERHGQARGKRKTGSSHHQLMGGGTYLCCLDCISLVAKMSAIDRLAVNRKPVPPTISW
jgi:hypothetical protein